MGILYIIIPNICIVFLSLSATLLLDVCLCNKNPQDHRLGKEVENMKLAIAASIGENEQNISREAVVSFESLKRKIKCLES